MSAFSAAVLTPNGRGAVATIRLQGDWSALETSGVFRTARGLIASASPIGRVLLAHWGPPPGEDVVLCRIDQHVLEVHCHGGQAAVARILADAAAAGAEVRTARELVEQSTGLFEAECLDALSRACTLRTAEILLEQASGTLRDRVQRLIDSRDLTKLDDILQWADFGRHLTAPWRVVLTGTPNVGKSSLINRLVGFERSIVNPTPGTTRDVVTAETALDGWPVSFEDTAGLRSGASALEQEGIARARARLGQADLVVIVFDVSQGLSEIDDALCAQYPDALLVGNKCDLAPTDAQTPPLAMNVSCITGFGLEILTEAIVDRLVPRVPESGMAVPVSERQIRLLQAALANNDIAPLRELLGLELPSMQTPDA